MAARKARKVKSAERLREEAEAKKRRSLIDSGIPEHRVAGEKVHDFKEEVFADLKERRKVIRALFSCPVDRWFAEGGIGFDAPQKRAVDHVRGLWAIIGTGATLTGRYDDAPRGGDGDRDKYVFARAQIAEYQDQFPAAYWSPFENMVRFEMPAVQAGAMLGRHAAEKISGARTCVGFIASKIAEWRGY